MTQLLDIPLVLFLLLVVAALGRRALTLSKIRFDGFGEQAVFSLGIGLGLLSHITLTLGIFGGLNRWYAYGVLALLVALLHRDMYKLGCGIVADIRKLDWRGMAWTVRAPIAILTALMFMNMVQALAPPTAADTMAYHFALPKLFAEQGRIFYIPDIQANGPLNQHMLYAFGMVLHQDIVAALISYAQGVALVVAIVLFSRKYFTTQTGLYAAVILYSVPLVTSIVSSGHIEMGLTFFTFLALWAFIEWTKKEDLRWLILTAVAVGLVAGTKYYGLFTLMSLGLLVTWKALSMHRTRLVPLVRVLVIFGVISAAVASPWYIRNIINTGNPVYPAFYGIFGGADWSPEMDNFFDAWVEAEKRPAGDSLLAFSTSIWDLLLNKAKYRATVPEYSPLYLAFAPALLWLFYKDKPRRRLYAYLFAFSAVFFTLWFWIAFQRARHLMPLMPWISIALSAAVISLLQQSRSQSGGRIIRIAVCSAAGVALLFNLGVSVLFNAQFFRVAIGAENKTRYITEQLWNYKDVQWINANLTSEDRLIHFNRTINYYLDVDYFFGSSFVQGRIDWANISNADQLVSRLKAENINYLFLDERELSVSTSDTFLATMAARKAIILKELIDSYGDEVYASDRLVPRFRTLDRETREIKARVYRLDFGDATKG